MVMAVWNGAGYVASWADFALCCQHSTIGFQKSRPPTTHGVVRTPCRALLATGLSILPVIAEEVPRPFDLSGWCLPENPGLLLDDPEARFLQQLKFGGYAHFHAANVDGRAAGRDFSYQRDSDWRRARLTADAKLLNAISLMAHVNVVEDEGRDGGGEEWDYQSLFLATAELDLKHLTEVKSLDQWSVGYGKRKLKELNEEMDTSINSILTVERSSLAAQLVPFREGTGTTGAWMTGGRGNDSVSIGLYTTDASPEFGNWTDGTMVVGAWKHDFSKALDCDEAILSLGGGFQDVQAGDEVYAPWEWVVTPWMKWRNDRFTLRASLAYGENEGPSTTTGGSFYGFSITPEYDIIPDRLQAVLRYTYTASEAPGGVQLTSRYAREAGRPANEAIPSLSTGRGDRHQSIYGGLVWWPCPKRLSILGGVEWEQLESRDSNVYKGTTLWLGTRVMF